MFFLQTDFLLIRALVPGLLQRQFVLFSVPVSFVFDWLSFTPRSSSRPSPNGSLLLSEANSIAFTPTFFCFPRFVSLSLTFVSCAISFHSSARILLPCRSLPFVVDLLQTIGCEWSSMSAFCLANIFHCIVMPRFWFAYVVPLFFPFKMTFWSKLDGKCRLPRPQWVGSSAIQSWKVILHASRSPQLQWNCRETAKSLKKER